MGGQGLFVRRRLGGAETCGLMPLTNCGAGRPHRPLQLFPFGGILRPTCRRSDGRGELLAGAESRGRRFVLWHVLRVYAGQVLRCKSHTTRPTTLSHERPGAYLRRAAAHAAARSRVVTGCRGPLGLKVELAFPRALRAAAIGVLSAAAPWKELWRWRLLEPLAGARGVVLVILVLVIPNH